LTFPAPIVHGTFRLERTYPASPQRVFQAFADPKKKRRWFADGEGWLVDEYTADFRTGGREITRFRRVGDTRSMVNETLYLEIVPDQRIVFTYTMTVGSTCFSASLSTVEIAPQGSGSTLIFTEQDAFLDGRDARADREQGSAELLERLGAFLTQDWR
jgi:uncharacterized protein YndB with AHSA1/START domain